MANSATAENIKLELSRVNRSLLTHAHRFIDQVNNIADIEKDFLSELERIEADEQRLSIGIMGQVKAGKSSFLNALLFAGKPILPEAATPKTANLTRISFGKQPQLLVHYYSPEEWEGFKLDAASDSDSTRTRVARSLLEMGDAHGVNASEVLGRGEEVFSPGDVQGLMGQLNDYVGENGRYTALVRYTEIQLPLPELNGFEIIDTPGMNDPVQSRTQKTRDYMAKCDVVFFLSRCSQFVDQSDMQLLTEHLPAKGVKRLILVGGQLDAVIADDGFDRASLADTEANVRTRLTRRAEVEIERLAAAREKVGSPEVAALLRNLKTPILASTYAHGYARWEKVQWGKGMCHMHQQLTEMAEDAWNGYQFTKDDWIRLGNFDALRAAYEQARQDKIPLMQARRDDLLPRTRANLTSALNELVQAAEHRIGQLRFGDIRSLEANAKACETQMAGISRRLGETINGTIKQSLKTAGEIRLELRDEIANAARIQTRTGTKKKTEKYTVSTSTWYKPWTWGDEETFEETRYVTYEYIATADAVERLVNYADETASSLSRAFNSIINMSSLRNDLKRTLIDELNTSSQEFDPAEFRNTLESALNGLALPQLELNIGDSSQLIEGKFSGEVRKKQKMDSLRQTLQESLVLVHNDLLTRFDESLKALCRKLEQTRDSLEQRLTESLQREMKQLKQDFTNKEAEIRRYEALIKTCQQAQVEEAS